ncbi:MAG: RagB/SusD family nutrient uptake outer membrane protein [Bacteroidetes bacterium]|nr:RagB/SusD family nutrient uptake outer membrane protein [Bacteroidota bacterium]
MKKRNKIFIYLVMMALAVGNFSCDKQLDVKPIGKLQLGDFWQSKEQSVAAIAGIYSILGSTSYNFSNGNMSETAMSPVESYIFWGEMRGELLASNPGKMPSNQIGKENVDNMNVSPVDVTTKYTAFYKIINQANQALKYIPGVGKKDPAFTEEDAANLTGEAYFLRAYAYFWLVRTFKEVPLVLEPSETDAQDYNVAKASADTLFARIVKDLEIAKRTLPTWYSKVEYSRIRATKYTAMTVLSDVCLWMAALSQNDAVKNDLYDKAISNCDAVINSGKYLLLPGPNFGTIWTVGGTEESIFETYSNSKVNNQVNNLLNWTMQTGYFLVSTNADELFDRLIFKDYRGATPPLGPYPEAGPVVGYNIGSRYIQKYSINTRDCRWNFYRYAEVLLMKAEALAHRSVDDPAKLASANELVNKIRFRGYGVNEYIKANATSTYEMDNILLDERGREFLGEGKRWFELVRFASRDNFLHKELLIDRILSGFNGVQRLVIAPRVNNPDSWYFPLNADALATNPNLVQNPYYQ